ncbi:glycosyltransferase 1 domain-containing protein 1-like [Pecten maximus]|uniref:glycosyltransferase 1 domain-containing protein 1-like n=1 Tax=Pecten maximus TaxID=6579 RepID=UPI0014581B7A|nr:glycosyltransferase 1 domain-containing protein 1-like [Pecten maximus]XP_033748038.1 glycosyltransferase 1 domain-containing protein 1-like [Pecten maximus]
MGSTILLLSPLTKGCGNLSTIQRISSHLESAGHSCILRDPDTISDSNRIQEIASQLNIQMVLALHAYKAGRHLRGTSLPFILIFGGTDINIYAREPEKLKVMTEVVFHAKGLIAFGQSLLDAARALWPSLDTNKCFEIKQAVVTNPSAFSITDYLRQNAGVEIPSDVNPKVFLFVGGIRPVKDPLYLVKHFSVLHRRRKYVFFVILGSMADESYNDEFMAGITGLPGVVYLPGLSLEDTHGAIKGSFALVNSSRSEGMAVAILEAMDLGVPVLVRDIPGNRSIVKDGVNGFVFASPEEFIQKSEVLLDEPTVGAMLVSHSTEYISEHHNVVDERTRYIEITSTALGLSQSRN